MNARKAYPSVLIDTDVKMTWGLRTSFLVAVVVLLSVSGVFATTVAAQEVETEIRFEDEVVAGEETTITYVTEVVETPVETDVDVDLTLLVDGEEVDTISTEDEVAEGAELIYEFTHVFDSAGKKEVTVDATASVSRFAPDLTESTTETVTVLSDGGGDGDDNETDDSTENSDGDDADTETTDTYGTSEDETVGAQAPEEGNEEPEEGLPGFTVLVTILVACVVVSAVALARQRED